MRIYFFFFLVISLLQIKAQAPFTDKDTILIKHSLKPLKEYNVNIIDTLCKSVCFKYLNDTPRKITVTNANTSDGNTYVQCNKKHCGGIVIKKGQACYFDVFFDRNHRNIGIYTTVSLSISDSETFDFQVNFLMKK